MTYPQKAILLLLICIASAFFVKREDDRGGLATANRTYVDWLIGNSKKKIQPPSVTLLKIDTSEESILQSWPPSPIDYSIMFRRLQLYGPKVVAADAPLNWKDIDDGELEILRVAGLQFDRGQLLLGAVLQQDPNADPPKASTLSLLRPLTEIEGDLDALPEFTNILSLPDRRLTSAGAQVGFTAIDLGESAPVGDSLLVPLLARNGETVVPSFVLLATMLELDAAPEDVVVILGESIVVKDDLVIPIDATGALNVFTGLRATLPAQNANILVLNPEEEGGGIGGSLGKEERKALASRVVLLGIDDEKSRSIPIGQGASISRAELFALAIATIQSGRYIEQAAPAIQWATWLGLVAAALLFLRFPRKRATGFALLLVILYFVANMLFFQSSQLWIPPAVPLALLACALLGALTLAGGQQKDPAQI